MRALDHIRFAVADCAKSKAFYDQALAPLRMTLLMEFSGAAAGFGRRNGEQPAFFIEAYGEPAARGRLHIALRAESRSTRFSRGTSKSGGTKSSITSGP